MLVRIKKAADGSSALTCVRDDGTATWQTQRGAQARFFPHHDLTHFAVESVLGFRRAFYGLVASGWNLVDFGSPWPRGPLPPDLEPAEEIVGLFDLERAGQGTVDAAAIRERLATSPTIGAAARALSVSDEQIAAIRARLGELFAEWSRVTPGATLELRWPA